MKGLAKLQDARILDLQAKLFIVHKNVNLENHQESIDKKRKMEHYQLHSNFLYEKEANALLDFLKTEIPWTQVKYFKPERGYVIVPRLSWVAGFHEEAHYPINDITPNSIPKFLSPLKTLVEEQLHTKFNFLLFSKYRDQNDSISYHSDNERFLENQPTIASITLGASRPFVLKHKQSKKVTTLNPSHGDLLVMNNNCQKDFFHAVPKQKTIVDTRYSITFKNVTNEAGSKNYYKFNLGKTKKMKFIKED